MTDTPDGAPKRPSITDQEALLFHSRGRPGKLEIIATKPMATQRDLSLAYSPGVAAPVKAIAADPSRAYDYTVRGNMIAVITNGTAILGLGNLGALAAKPVMEGKAVLFKRFADINSIDLEIDTEDPEEFINSVRYLGPIVRRHQPRGHQGAGVLHHRRAPARIDGYSRLSRRSARHRDHRRRRPDQRHATDRARHQDDAAGVQRRGRGRHRLPRSDQGDRLRAVERNPVRHQGRRLSRPQGGHEPMEVGARRRHAAAHVGGGDGRRRHLLRPFRQGRADARDGQDDGAQPDHLRHGQSRSRDHARGGADGARRRHHRHGAFGLSQPDQQCPGLSLYLSRRARCARQDHQHGDEDRGGARSWPNSRARTCPTKSRSPIAARGRVSGASTSSPCRSIRASSMSCRSPWPRRRWRPASRSARLSTWTAYKAQLSARRDPIAGAMQRIIERVRRMPKRVVFAEGEEEQVIRAAYSFVNQGLGTAILVGREDRVRAVAAAIRLRSRGKGRRNPQRAAFARATPSTRNSSTSGCSGAASCCAIASA